MNKLKFLYRFVLQYPIWDSYAFCILYGLDNGTIFISIDELTQTYSVLDQFFKSTDCTGKVLNLWKATSHLNNEHGCVLQNRYVLDFFIWIKGRNFTVYILTVLVDSMHIKSCFFFFYASQEITKCVVCTLMQSNTCTSSTLSKVVHFNMQTFSLTRF
jgi:hypothetical protein